MSSLLDPVPAPAASVEQALLDASREGVLAVRGGNVVAGNRAARELWGIEPHEPLSVDRLLEVVHPLDVVSFRRLLGSPPAQAQASAGSVRLMLMGAVRSVRYDVVPSSVAPVTILLFEDPARSAERDEALRRSHQEVELRVAERLEGLRLANEALRDEIQERHRVALALRRSEIRFRMLAEATPTAILVVEADLVQYANAALIQLVGRPVLAGNRLPDVLPTLPEGWATAGRQGQLEVIVPREDGPRVCLVRVAELPLDGGRADLLSVEDVTERRSAERLMRRHLEELASASRALTAAELSASLAHELNQPLAAIATYAHGCVARLGDASPDSIARLGAGVRRIADEAARAASIVHRLRALFERRSDVRSVVELPKLVQQAVDLMASDLSLAGTQARVEARPELPTVLGDPQQLQLVFLNLLRNAAESAKAAKPPRRIDVRFERIGDDVVAQVFDTGPLVRAEIAARLFDPFFTTREGGFGLGLAIARTVAEAHGGTLAYHAGSPGKRFELRVPALGSGGASRSAP